MAERLFVEITDAAGRVSPEFVRAETVGPVGESARFVRDDGSYWTFPDGSELRAALEPERRRAA